MAKLIIRCQFCNGELERNSAGQIVNIMGDPTCSYAPVGNGNSNHQPLQQD